MEWPYIQWHPKKESYKNVKPIPNYYFKLKKICPESYYSMIYIKAQVNKYINTMRQLNMALAICMVWLI